MLLIPEVSPTDGPLHQQNLLLLNYASMAANADTFSLYARALLEVGDSVLLLPSSGSLSKTVIVRNQAKSQLLIIICGMSGFEQVPLCIQSWSDTSSPTTAFNTYESGALTISQNMAFVPQGGYDGVRVIGHSYGGAVALWLPLVLNSDVATNALLQIYTYGAPKPWSRQQDQGRTRWLLRRCFQNTDPVPSLPVTSSDVGNLWAYLGVPTARAWEQWVQSFSGLVFDGFNHLVSSPNPTKSASPTIFYLSLARWATGNDAFGADVHSLASYTQACSSLIAATIPATSPATMPLRSPAIASTHEMALHREENLAVIATNVNANPMDAAQGIQSGIVIVPGVRYRGVTIRGEPWVYYGAEPVVPAKTRRTRRALVRYLNRNL